MINLGELAAVRSAMTPGEYARGQWQRSGRPDFKRTHIAPDSDEDASIAVVAPPPAGTPDDPIVGGCGCCGSPSGKAADIEGLVRTHNVADQLIAVARAALVMRDALRAHVEAEASGLGLTQAWAKIRECNDALDQALEGVES